jgi:hypothetical protein
MKDDVLRDPVAWYLLLGWFAPAAGFGALLVQEWPTIYRVGALVIGCLIAYCGKKTSDMVDRATRLESENLKLRRELERLKGEA